MLFQGSILLSQNHIFCKTYIISLAYYRRPDIFLPSADKIRANDLEYILVFCALSLGDPLRNWELSCMFGVHLYKIYMDLIFCIYVIIDL